jgi:hypothetical protein
VTADRSLRCLLALATATLVAAPTASAAPYSGLKHACKYTYGVGDYQSVSYDGHTSCAEASGLIDNVTAEGTRAPKVGTRTGRTPHGTWRCVTIRRKEAHGVIYSSHRITCSLTDDPQGRRARVRFFYES